MISSNDSQDNSVLKASGRVSSKRVFNESGVSSDLAKDCAMLSSLLQNATNSFRRATTDCRRDVPSLTKWLLISPMAMSWSFLLWPTSNIPLSIIPVHKATICLTEWHVVSVPPARGPRFPDNALTNIICRWTSCMSGASPDACTRLGCFEWI